VSRHVYISCDYGEEKLSVVKAICSFLYANNCIIDFTPPFEGNFYRTIEDLIDSCDSFIAVIGHGYQISTCLHHQLYYANTLNSVRASPRPRLFGIKIDGYELPPITSNVVLEWLETQESYKLLLEDLPERT
jgi:hypothetical protein